jgi:hypothetical protein
MKPEWEGIKIEDREDYRLWEKEDWREIKLTNGKTGVVVGHYANGPVLRHKLVYVIEDDRVGIMFNIKDSESYGE